MALAMAVVLAYPIGVLSGWYPGRSLDVGARTFSGVVLLLPTFLVILAVLAVGYGPFLRVIGDSPFGTLPPASWWLFHGTTTPRWVGSADNTSPMGFPLVDGLIHGAWAFEGVVLAKTLLQAFCIALVYVALYLRYLRHVVLAARDEPYVVAARARGVEEGTLLWRHTG